MRFARQAIETTVEMESPDSGRARTVIRSRAGALETAVAPGADGWIRVPVPLSENVGDDDLSFAAVIRPPAGYRIEDPFPTRVETEGAEARLNLPAPPSLLRFRLVPEDAPKLGLPAVVDAASLILLLGLAVLGAIRLRRAP